MSIMQPLYYLPQETAALLSEERIKQCKNPGLLLNKYLPQSVLHNSARKNLWLRNVIHNKSIDEHLALHTYRRWLAFTTHVGAQHFHATTDWHLAIGVHTSTVLETSLTLHPLYGLPLIPGSALKGLCKTYVTEEQPEYSSKRLNGDDDLLQRIFGTPTQSGTVTFFDAIPFEGKATFALDITNVHYPDYYTQGKAPGNDQRPNPILFLTVTDTLFAFALAPHNLQQEAQKDDVFIASQWLQEALREYGVGSKTSAGYGYLTSQ